MVHDWFNYLKAPGFPWICKNKTWWVAETGEGSPELPPAPPRSLPFPGPAPAPAPAPAQGSSAVAQVGQLIQTRSRTLAHTQAAPSAQAQTKHAAAAATAVGIKRTAPATVARGSTRQRQYSDVLLDQVSTLYFHLRVLYLWEAKSPLRTHIHAQVQAHQHRFTRTNAHVHAYAYTHTHWLGWMPTGIGTGMANFFLQGLIYRDWSTGSDLRWWRWEKYRVIEKYVYNWEYRKVHDHFGYRIIIWDFMILEVLSELASKSKFIILC